MRGLESHGSAPVPWGQWTHTPRKMESRGCRAWFTACRRLPKRIRWDFTLGGTDLPVSESQRLPTAGILRVLISVFVIAGAATGVSAEASMRRLSSGRDGYSEGLKAGVSTTPQDSSELFRRHCTPCHGKSGKGDGPAAAYLNPRPADLTKAEVVGQLSDEELLDVITNGRRTMPSFRALLKPEELRAVAAYVRSLEKG